MDDAWLVWSFQHDMWWRANSCGYTTEFLLAGVYTENEAKAIEAQANKWHKEPQEEARKLTDVLGETKWPGEVSGLRVIDVMAGRTL
jgi:hypothetical protein